MLEQSEVNDEPRDEESYKKQDPQVLENKLMELCRSYLTEMDKQLSDNKIEEALERTKFELQNNRRSPLAINFYAYLVLKKCTDNNLKNTCLQLLLKTSKKNSTDKLTLYNLGLYCIEYGQFQEALDFFNKLDSYSPEDARTFFNISYCLEKVGKQEKAQRGYLETIKKNEKYAPAYINSAIMLAKNQDSIPALAQLQKFEEKISNGQENIQNNIIPQMFEDGQEEIAGEKFDQLINMKKEKDKEVIVKPNYLTDFNYAMYLYKTEQIDAALSGLKKLCETCPDKKIKLMSFINFGQISEDDGKDLQALEAYRKCYKEYGKLILQPEVIERITLLTNKCGLTPQAQIEADEPEVEDNSNAYMIYNLEESREMNLIFDDETSDVRPQNHLPNEVLSKQSDDMDKKQNDLEGEFATNEKPDENLDDNMDQKNLDVAIIVNQSEIFVKDAEIEDINESSRIEPKIEEKSHESISVNVEQDGLDVNPNMLSSAVSHDNINLRTSSRKSIVDMMQEDVGFQSRRGSQARLTELAKMAVDQYSYDDNEVQDKDETQLSSVTTMIEEWTKEYCLEKLREDSNNFKAHYRLAFLEIDENDYSEEFKVHQEEVHRIKPDYKPVVVTLTLGEIYWSEKNYQKAQDYYLKNKEVTEDKVQCIIRIGECYEKMGELDKAKVEYKKALKINQKNPWVLYRLGKIYYIKNMHEKATEKLYKSIFYEPEHYKCLVRYGLNFMAQKEPKVSQALDTFDKAQNLNGLPVKYEIKCLKEKANCLDRLNEVDSAIETCKAWVQIDPYNLEAKEYLAQQYLKNKDNKKALSLYKQILKENRSNSRWYQEIGTLYALNGQFDNARKYLQQSLKIEPNNGTAGIRLGKILQTQQNDPQGALDVYNSILKVDPGNYLVLYQLGVTYFDQNDLVKGAQFLKESLKSNPKYVRGWNTLADFMMKQKKYESAIKFFERASNIDPNCLDSKIGVGKCNYYMKNLDEALEIFETIEPKYPNNYEVMYNLGNCFYLKGSFYEAQKKFKKCHEKYPDKVEALFSLGNIYCELNDFIKGAEIFEKVIKKDPNNLKARRNQANCYLMNNRYEDVIHNLECCQQIEPNNYEIIMNLANIYMQKGDLYKAKDYLLQVISKDKKNQQAHLKLGQLYNIMGSYESALEELEIAKKLNPLNEDIDKAIEQVNKRFFNQ